MRQSHAMRRPRAAVLTLTALCTLVTGCSSGPEPPRAEPATVELGGTSWIGPCSGSDRVGAYSFTFRPGPAGDGGTVEVGTPDATAPRSVPYTVSRTDGSGSASFTVAFTPPWTGTLRRDYRNLVLRYQVGDTPGVRHCDLQRATLPQATG